ncbi:MAG TPA: FecR domain-containing protein [Flavisolibacter sp.]|nr:FecR domain-containing protein [Flavisolibacter sp.]
MHKNYLLFTENDFIADEYFQRWIQSPDAEVNAFWNQLIAAHPNKQSEIIRAKTFLENLQFSEHLPSEHGTESSYSNLLLKINAVENAQKQSIFKRLSHAKWNRWAVAAFFAGCIAIAALQLREQESLLIEVVAGTNEIKSIQLPDSSLVTLNAGSKISYSTDLETDDIREVWLDGEAYFDVKHVENNHFKKSFIVHTGELKVEVLGTTFNIKRQGAFTNVTLNTGQIKIALNKDPKTSIYLQPGDFLRYSEREKKIIKKQVRPELYSVWKEEKLPLDNMPLYEIAQLLEDTYGYHVQIKDRELADSKISGTLHLKDEATLFETLSVVLDLDIKKQDSTIYFNYKNKN